MRKLKELGLTESLLVGYRLSPRGQACWRGSALQKAGKQSTLRTATAAPAEGRPSRGSRLGAARRVAAQPGYDPSPRAHQARQALALRLRRVGAARVERLVARDEVGPVGAQPVHEDVAHLAAQVQADAADRDRAGLGAELEDLLDLRRASR